MDNNSAMSLDDHAHAHAHDNVNMNVEESLNLVVEEQDNGELDRQQNHEHDNGHEHDHADFEIAPETPHPMQHLSDEHEHEHEHEHQHEHLEHEHEQMPMHDQEEHLGHGGHESHGGVGLGEDDHTMGVDDIDQAFPSNEQTLHAVSSGHHDHLHALTAEDEEATLLQAQAAAVAAQYVEGQHEHEHEHDEEIGYGHFEVEVDGGIQGLDGGVPGDVQQQTLGDVVVDEAAAGLAQEQLVVEDQTEETGPTSVMMSSETTSQPTTKTTKTPAKRGARAKNASVASASPASTATATAAAAAAAAALEETERQLQKLNREAMPTLSSHSQQRGSTSGASDIARGPLPLAGTSSQANVGVGPIGEGARTGKSLQYAGPPIDLSHTRVDGALDGHAEQQSEHPIVDGQGHHHHQHQAGVPEDVHAHAHADADADQHMHDVTGIEGGEEQVYQGQQAQDHMVPKDVKYGGGYARFVEEFAVRQGLIQPDQQSPMLTGWLALSQEERDRYGEIMNDYSNEDEEFKQGQDESLEGFTTRLTQKATNMVRRVFETCHINYLLLCSPPFITPPDFPVLSMSPPAEFFWQGLRGGPATNLTKFLSLSHPAVTTRRLAIPFGARSLDVKSRLNAHMRKIVRETSGIADAEMKWTRPESLIQSYGVKIVGWPNPTEEDEGIPMRNPSNNNAKQNRRLLEMAEKGDLRIEVASAEDRQRVQEQMEAEAAVKASVAAASKEEEEDAEEEYEDEEEGDGVDGEGGKKRKRKVKTKSQPRIKRPRVKPLLTLNPDGTIRHGGLEGRRRPGRPRNADRPPGEIKPKKPVASRKGKGAGRKKKQAAPTTAEEQDVDAVGMISGQDQDQEVQDAQDHSVMALDEGEHEHVHEHEHEHEHDHDHDHDHEHEHEHEGEGDGMYLPEGDIGETSESAMALAGMMMENGGGTAQGYAPNASLNDAFNAEREGSERPAGEHYEGAQAMEQAMQYFHQHGQDYYQPEHHHHPQQAHEEGGVAALDPMLTRQGEAEADPAAQAVADMLMHQEE